MQAITNRIQEIEDRFSGIEGTIEVLDTPVKENSKGKKHHNTKHPVNSGHNEKTKSKNDRNREGQRFPDQRI